MSDVPLLKRGSNVLVACEFSGVVRDAFIRKGHSAISCDIIPGEAGPPHYIGDVTELLNLGHWDLMIAHPPCTYLCNSGVRHMYIGGKKENGRCSDRWQKMLDGAAFFKQLLDAPIPRICIENPVMHGMAKQRIGTSQTQSIQPWQFGHGEVKRTCLWLKGLPPLVPTDVVQGREARVHRMSPGPDRGKLRSVTYTGIAEAMSEQWSDF